MKINMILFLKSNISFAEGGKDGYIGVFKIAGL